MSFSEEEVLWLIQSKAYRKTRTVRLDERLVKNIPKMQLSDYLNLALKRFLEERMIAHQQGEAVSETATVTASNQVSETIISSIRLSLL